MTPRLINSTKPKGRACLLGALGLSASMIPVTAALALDDAALPSGGSVTAGSATLDYSTPAQLNVFQSSDRAVIHWDSFNIGAGAMAQFHQPSASSVTVNRVTGANQDPSRILGSLKANGTVMVLDRNGVIFGENSQVDVGSIVVGTGEMDEQSFINGDQALILDNFGTGSAIVNNGHITVADAGLAAFVAPTIVNNGVITARLGKVALASGTRATVDLYGDKLVELAADIPVAGAKIDQKGKISAEGGTVLLTAAAAKSIVDHVINMSGVVDVSSVKTDGGKIILEGANANVSGTLNASGKNGGSIKIGGDYLGGGTIHHADRVTIAKDAVVTADAKTPNGDGGKVIVWSDEQTIIAGEINANGGTATGNGGFIETSSKEKLNVQAGAKIAARGGTDGQNGEWLLDPRNVYLRDASGTNASAGGTVTAGSDNQVVDVNTIETALNNGLDVTIYTGTTGNGSQNGDIFVEDSIRKTAGGNATLSLRAEGNIVLDNTDSDGDLPSIISTFGLLNLILNADRDANQNGAISITGSTIATNGGYFVAGGGTNPLAAHAVGTSGSGIYLSGSSIDTNGGAVTMRGKTTTGGGSGVRLTAGSSINSGAGAIAIYGHSSDVASQGITLDGHSGRSSINSTSGDIYLEALSTYTQAFYLWQNAGVTSTSGNIDIAASGSAVNDVESNRWTTPSVINIESASGNVTLTADLLALDKFSAIRGGNRLLLKPKTASAGIGLGGGTGAFNLDDAELAILGGGNLVIGNSAAGTGDIDVDSWDLSSATYNVELYGNDIDLGGLTLGSGNFTAHAMDNAAVDLGSLTVSAATTKSVAGTSTLALRADKDIVFNSGANVTASGSAVLNTVINSDRDADQDGAISLTTASVTTKGGYFIAGGGGGALGGTNGIFGDGDGTGADDVAARANASYVSGVKLDHSTITTDGGAVFIKGTSSGALGTSYGVHLTYGSLFADAGDINVAGRINLSDTNSQGIRLDHANLRVSTGTMRLNGQQAITSSSTNNTAFYSEYSSINSTDNGAMYITGTSTIASGSAHWSIDDVSFNLSSAVNYKNGLVNIKSDHSFDGGVGITLGGSSILGTGDGDLTIETNKDGYHNVFRTTWGTNVIGGADNTGDIILNARNYSTGATNPTISTTGDIYIKPRDASHTMLLGGMSGLITNIPDAMFASMKANKVIVGDSTAPTGDVTIDSLNLSAANYALEIYGNDVIFQDTDSTTGVDYALLLGTKDVLAHAIDNAAVDLGVLNVNAAIRKTTSGTSALTLRADKDIAVASGANLTASGSAVLNTVLNADRDADSDGVVSITSAAVTTNGGYFVAGGGSGALGGTNSLLGDGDGTGADDVAAFGNATNGVGVSLSGGSISTGTGSIFLKGNGGSANNQVGVSLGSSSSLATTSGGITIIGTGGSGQSGTSGVGISGSTIETNTGKIRITGTAKGQGDNGSNDFDRAVSISGSTVRTQTTTAGSGAIEINGSAALSGATKGRGVDINTGSTVETQAGNISLNATGGSTGEAFVLYGNNSVQSLADGDMLLDTNNGMVSLAGVTGNVLSLGGASTNNLEIRTGTFYIDNSNLSSLTSGVTAKTVLLKASDPASTIGLAGGSGTLSLSDARIAFLKPVNKLVIGDSTAATGDVHVNTWDLGSAAFDVEIYGNDVTLGGLTLGTGNFTAYAMDNAAVDLGTLTVSGATTKTTAGTSSLTLRADKDIVVNSSAPITASGSAILNTVFNADRDADQDGAISVTTSAITTNGGYFIAGGGAGALGGTNGILGDGDGTGADDVAAWGSAVYASGVFLSNGDVSTGGGLVLLRGQGYHDSAQSFLYGVNIANGSLIETTTGDVRLFGRGGNGDDKNYGVTISGVGGIQSQKGAIRLEGTGGSRGTSGSNDNAGVYLGTSAKIESLGTGTDASTIDIIGQAGGGDLGNNGVMLAGATVTSKAGDITISGSGNATTYSRGVFLNGNSKILSTGSADIHLTGNSLVDLFSFSTGNVIGGADALGDIVVDANTIDLSGMEIRTAGDIYLKPRTASTSIGISGGYGMLDLSDAELAMLFADRLIIGDSLNGSGDIDVNDWDLTGHAFDVELYGNDIDLGGLSLGGTSFSAYAKNAAADSAALNVSASIVKSTTGAASLDLRSENGLSFAAGADVSASAGSMNMIFAGDVDADSFGAITSSNSAFESRGGDITLIGAAQLSGAHTLNAGAGSLSVGAIDAGSHNLTLIGDSLAIGGTVSTTGILGLRPHTTNRSIGLGGATGDFNLDDTELAYIDAGSLSIGNTSSRGDVAIDSWDLSGKNYHTRIFGSDFNLGGLSMGAGDVDLYAFGGLQVTAPVAAGSGTLNILSIYDILVGSAVQNNGPVNMFAGWDGTSAIAQPGLFDAAAVDLGLTAREVTIGPSGSISSSASGTAVLIAASGGFVNQGGVSAISAAGGRYLVYSDNPADTAKGGLAAKNLYNVSYNDTPPSNISGTASRFVYHYQPTLTLTADDYSGDAGTLVTSYSVSGLETDDALSDALSGTPSFSLGAQTGNQQSIILMSGTTTSPLGYQLAYTNGIFTITAPPAPDPARVEQPVSTILNRATNLLTIAQSDNAPSGGETVPTGQDTQNTGGARQTASCLVSDASGCLIR